MNKDLSEQKRNGHFDIVIIGDYDDNEKLFSNTFPILKKNLKHKYLNRFDLCIREEIKYPKEFAIKYYPELMDKMANIDILILTYNASNKLTFELLQKFYYIYYSKLEERDKAKVIIIVELDYPSKYKLNNDIKIDSNDSQKIINLFKSNFFVHKDSKEKLIDVLKNSLKKLIEIYGFQSQNKYFYNIDSDNDINIVFLLYGNEELLSLFIKMLLNSNSHLVYKKFQDNFYELKYKKYMNDFVLNFKIKLITMEKGPCCNDSTCNILLYDINKKESYISIKKIIEEYISFNGPKFTQLFNIISFNNSADQITYRENDIEIKNGKSLADELGASFSHIKVNNNKSVDEQIYQVFDNIFDQIINTINNISNKTEIGNKESIVNRYKSVQISNSALRDHDSSLLHIKDINNKIKQDFKDNVDFLGNICPICYEYMDIKINEASNLIILFCKKCQNDSTGLDIEEFNKYKKIKNKSIHCPNCQKILNYDFQSNKLFCACESIKILKNKNINKSGNSNEIFIPCYLKSSFCSIHKKFHKYYMKYSKKGLCEDCKDRKKEKTFFIEDFNQKEINHLIQIKKKELNKEFDFITSLQNKFNQCIASIFSKFEALIQKKIRMHMLKSELINNLEIIKNNYTVISNVNSLKFDLGDNFTYNENDSTEKKIKNIFNYLNSEINIKNFYFGKEKNCTENIHNGPYNNLINVGKNTIITDICSLNNNKYICLSYDDGQAKIFDSNIYEKNSYPICIIKEFMPNLGINSIYVSKKGNIWGVNNDNKNELIYLNGFEELKIIQMNANYDSYNLLYTVKDEFSNIYNSIDIYDNSILMLNNISKLKLVSFDKREDNEINEEHKDISNLLIPSDKLAISLKKVSEFIITLTLTKNNTIRTRLYKNKNDTNINNDYNQNIQQRKRSDSFEMNSFDFSGGEISIDFKDYTEYEQINQSEQKEQYIKIFYLNHYNYEIKEDNDTKEIYNDLKIKKEYIFDSKFSLLGSISEEDNLLLLNYSENNNNIIENIFYIFDFNICQFIKAFKYHNIWKAPILFEKINYHNLLNKKEFIICDEDMNIIQYIYDKNYANKIYYISSSKANEKLGRKPFKLICLNNLIILLCNNSEYYTINI